MNRKQSAVIQIITFSITAIVLVGVLIAGITGHFFTGNFVAFNFSDNYSYKDADKYIAGAGEVNADGIQDIDINWLDGAIDVVVYDGDTIRFSETAAKDLEPEDQLRYYEHGSKLIIQYCKEKNNSFFSRIEGLHKKLTVKVPKTLAGKLDILSIDTISSNTNVTDINAKKINHDSTSANLLLRNSTAGELDFDSTSGSFTGEGVTVTDKLEADTTSGLVEIDGSVENVRFDTVSGDLKIGTDTCPQKVNADTVSGEVTLFLPENDGFTCYRDTVSGSYSSEFELRWEDDKGIYKNGGRKFSFNSVSGDVTINRNTAE